VGFLRQSGAKAAARSAYREAAAYFEQALIALGHLPETRETLQQGIDLRFDLRTSVQALGEHERVFEHLRDAEILASALGDQDRLGWASAYLCQYLWWMGDSAQAEASGQRALTIALAEPALRRQTPFALQVVANFFLGQGYFHVGDYRRAIDHCRRNVAVLEGERAHERHGLTGLPAVLSHIWLAWSLAEQGEFSEAMAHAEEALSVAEAADQPYSVGWACVGVGQVRVIQGALDQAIPVLERAGRLCEIWDLAGIFPMVAALLGLAHALCGRVAEALPLLEEGEAQAPPVTIFEPSTATTALGAGYLLAERMDDASAAASRVAELYAERGFRGGQARALQLVGEISARREPPEAARAEDHYRRALALAEELGMRPLVAHSHLGLGRLYQRTSKRQEAKEHIATALAMYRDMDMRFWLEQENAEVKSLG
jgi:tetratricopeptide (TPR) repeat protein